MNTTTTKHLMNKLLLIICFQGLLGLQQAYAAIYYVSPSGLDTNNGTSLTTPVKTIKKALSKATVSGDVVYVRAGTYSETVVINSSGIALSAYQTEVPVIDGGTSLPSLDWDALISINGNNNTVTGFEVKNSNINGARQGGYGIQVSGAHNTISKVNVHHTWQQGILINGDYGIVQDSTIWQAARANMANPGTSGWGAAISAARNTASSAIKKGITSFAVFRRNTVYNNWGEGISCYEVDYCTIEDNISYDNWTVNLYLSDATNSLVQRNIIYVSSNPAIPTRNNTHPGLLLADEIASVPRSTNNIIINNFIYNADLRAFNWTGVANSGLNNTLIAYNTVVNGGLSTGAGGSPAIVNVNSQIRNNIFSGSNSSVPSTTGITFSNNNWGTPPAAAKATSDVVTDPQILRTSVTTAGNLTKDYFKVSATSPVINAATPLASAPQDFFLTTRASKPTIGGYEFVSTTSTPAPTPIMGITYYVSPTGSDSNNGNLLTTPLKTINAAINKAVTGDTIYVLSGTYSETVSISKNGITLSAYPNNTPIIDGGSSLPNVDWGALISVSGNKNTISGFEVRNSNINGVRVGGYGIQVEGANNTISKMNVHHTWQQGVLINGDYDTVENSTIWQASRMYANTTASSGWGTGISAARNASATAIKKGITSYPTLRRNIVFNNWGEGISCYETDHCTMEDNISYDNWTINLFLSDATNSLVQRNIVYISSAPAIPTRNGTRPGILLADEVATAPRSANNTLINNFVYNADFSAFSWSGVAGSGLNNVLIANNTIVDGALSTGQGGNPAIVNSNSQIRNNIITGSSSVPSNSGITFSNNNWMVAPPAAAKSSSDVIANPQIIRAGTTAPGTLTSAYFKIPVTSPAVNAATPLPSIMQDFFLTPRNTTTPNIGGHEIH